MYSGLKAQFGKCIWNIMGLIIKSNIKTINVITHTYATHFIFNQHQFWCSLPFIKVVVFNSNLAHMFLNMVHLFITTGFISFMLIHITYIRSLAHVFTKHMRYRFFLTGSLAIKNNFFQWLLNCLGYLHLNSACVVWMVYASHFMAYI